ncbi:MAG: hypothetical protein IPP74_12495 [Alphaproteobacteria bacterium]|nr:hypothetical protein [Alphaproteobacteria bacterium]
MTDLTTLQARLAAAEEAYHQLLIGAQAVNVNIGGYGSTTYASVDMSKLKAYIDHLKAEINKVSGNARRGIIKVAF